MLKRTVLFIFISHAVLTACTKQSYSTPEDNCYFKGVFNNEAIELKYNVNKGIGFVNGPITDYGVGWYTYGQTTQLRDCVDPNSNTPFLKVEFRNLLQLPGNDFDQVKVDSLFPSLFEVGEYTYAVKWFINETFDIPTVLIEYTDRNGHLWSSIGSIYYDDEKDQDWQILADQSNSHFEITSSRLVKSDRYPHNKHIMEVKGIFSCILHFEDEQFEVEDVEFQYLYFNNKY
ncbi:MAG: hypothetical protein MI866_19400 [Bacteroidales bacterium]|nr:hypothetical protein [Bacteroidales bacterium]